jgi:hypothetical protein
MCCICWPGRCPGPRRLGEGGPGLAFMATCKGKTESPCADFRFHPRRDNSAQRNELSQRRTMIHCGIPSRELAKTQRRRRNRDPDLVCELDPNLYKERRMVIIARPAVANAAVARILRRFGRKYKVAAFRARRPSEISIMYEFHPSRDRKCHNQSPAREIRSLIVAACGKLVMHNDTAVTRNHNSLLPRACNRPCAITSSRD